MYNSYEEYMQSMLGFNAPNTYRENGGYYEVQGVNSNIQDTSRFYPEIYGVVYPLVQKVCGKANMMRFNGRKYKSNGRRSIQCN